jgi:hypothetical protein
LELENKFLICGYEGGCPSFRREWGRDWIFTNHVVARGKWT